MTIDVQYIRVDNYAGGKTHNYLLWLSTLIIGTDDMIDTNRRGRIPFGNLKVNSTNIKIKFRRFRDPMWSSKSQFLIIPKNIKFIAKNNPFAKKLAAQLSLAALPHHPQLVNRRVVSDFCRDIHNLMAIQTIMSS